MNKTVVAVVAIIACAVVAIVFFLFGKERYVTVNAGNSAMYKIDRITGETTFIRGSQETPVLPLPPPPPQKEYSEYSRTSDGKRILREEDITWDSPPMKK